MSEYITMHGASLDGSGEIVQTEVHVNNVQAFKNSGWKEGAKPVEWSNDLGAVKYTLEDSIAQLNEPEMETETESKPKQKRGRRK